MSSKPWYWLQYSIIGWASYQGQLDCLINNLFRPTSDIIVKSLCEGNHRRPILSQSSGNSKSVPMSWRHNVFVIVFLRSAALFRTQFIFSLPVQSNPSGVVWCYCVDLIYSHQFGLSAAYTGTQGNCRPNVCHKRDNVVPYLGKHRKVLYSQIRMDKNIPQCWMTHYPLDEIVHISDSELIDSRLWRFSSSMSIH